MERLDPDEVGKLAQAMADTSWSWKIEDLDGFLDVLALRRDRQYGDFPELVMLPLSSDRIPGQAGMVDLLQSGAVISVSVSVTDRTDADDAAGKAELDDAMAQAQEAVRQRFGSPKGRTTPTWDLDDRQLELDRMPRRVRLTIVHRANRDVSEGR